MRTWHCGCGGIMERVPHLRCPNCGNEPFKCDPNPLRDTYRKKVYDWERALKGWPGKKLTLQECKELVMHVWSIHKSSKWHVPVVKDGRGCRSARGGKDHITLPTWSRTTYVVLHELSHSIVATLTIPHPAHGLEFCMRYLLLLERYAGVRAPLPPFLRRVDAAARKPDKEA